MNIESLAPLAEIISSVGVIVSLIYVSVQVRQNTRALKATTYNQITANSVAIMGPWHVHAEFTEFLARMTANPDAVTPAQKLRFHVMLLTCFRHWDNLYYQFRSGALDREMWESYDRSLTLWLANKAWRDWFRDNSEYVSGSLRDLVNTRLQQH